MANVLADPLPEGVYTPDLAAIVKYSRASTLLQPITNELWKGLSDHFDTKQILDIIFIMGMDQIISRMHATIRTEVDGFTLDEVAPSCPVPLPPLPADGAGAMA